MRGAGKPAVREQGDGFAKAGAHNGTGHTQHFSHAGSSLRPFIPNHDDVAIHDFPVLYRSEGVFFAIKHLGRTGMGQLVMACDFDHAPVGSQVSVQNHQAARGLDRLFRVIEDFLARRFRSGVGFFPDGASRDGHAFALEQACLKQSFGHETGPAGLI